VKTSKHSKGQSAHTKPKNNRHISNSTPKSLNAFKSVEHLIMTLTKKSKLSTECQDASEGYSSANILDLSPIQPVNNASRTSQQSSEQHPVTRYETAFGPDNQTVTRVFYADGIATDFNHVEGRAEMQRTPIETHFEGSPPSADSGAFSRKNSLRHSMHNLFNSGASIRERKVKREKSSAKRNSAGSNLNDESYGCTVGVYSRTNSDGAAKDTPVSRLAPVSRSESCAVRPRSSRHSGKPPVYAMPPTYDALYPESLYPKSTHPVMDASRKFLKRQKSLSSASLNHKTSFVEMGGNSSIVHDKCQGQGSKSDQDMAVGRSLSMSDLAGATPPVENELQKQCMGHIQESDDSKYASSKFCLPCFMRLFVVQNWQ
jgi:hypothetical protein